MGRLFSIYFKLENREVVGLQVFSCKCTVIAGNGICGLCVFTRTIP
jgi:hypothetical protein